MSSLPTSDDATSSEAYDEAVQSFVAFWGEMASQWGINRTMAQIHARLFCADAPMNTDEIMEALDISRGNANMNLHSLTDWKLVTKTQQPGSRKDYYKADTDVWHITARIIEERQRRELHPVQDRVAACRDMIRADQTTEPAPRAEMLDTRLSNLIELIEVFDQVSEALLPLVQMRDKETLDQLVQMVRLVVAESSSETASSEESASASADPAARS